MFPGMVFVVLSRDPDVVRDIAVLLKNAVSLCQELIPYLGISTNDRILNSVPD